MVASPHNYAQALSSLERYGEAKALLRKTMPVARRVLGEGYRLTLKMRWNYAGALCHYAALCRDDNTTLADLREAVATLEDVERIARRVFGSAYGFVANIEDSLRAARAALHACETPSGSP